MLLFAWNEQGRGGGPGEGEGSFRCRCSDLLWMSAIGMCYNYRRLTGHLEGILMKGSPQHDTPILIH